MKALKVIVIALIVLVVVAVVGLYLSAGSVIKTGVETVGPKVTGVPITLDAVSVSVFSGEARLKELVVGNPEGFKTDHAFRLGLLLVDVDGGSVLSDRVVINKILIDAPEITYEAGLGTSNLGKILEHIKAQSASEPEADVAKEAEPERAAPGKKVQINEFTLSNARIMVSAKMLGGRGLEIPLPTIHLKDIGKERDGASVAEVTAEVVSAVVKAVGRARDRAAPAVRVDSIRRGCAR